MKEENEKKIEESVKLIGENDKEIEGRKCENYKGE
jgi:hypothetical protein